MTDLTAAAPSRARLDERSTTTSTMAVCVPARDEEATIGPIVSAARRSDVAEILVVDDGSTDRTAGIARRAGAHVVSTPPRGKGQALRTAIASTTADVIVFIDADLTSFDTDHIGALAHPILSSDQTMLVKPRYRRSLHGRSNEGGRVTELVARPLLRLHRPQLAHLSQPLAGEFAVRRTALQNLTLADGYAVDLALLIDIADRYGPHTIAEVDLGHRRHRNRPLRELTDQATEILAAALQRLGPPPDLKPSNRGGQAP